MPNLGHTPPPFRLRVLPAEAFSHPSWKEARARALAALGRGQSLLVLGKAGTGKTLLLQSLGESLHAEGKRALGFGVGTEHENSDVVLVDEVGSLDAAALQRLFALRQPFVASGLPEIEPQVLECHHSVEVVRLSRLTPEDVTRYLVGRLAATGRAPDLFQPAGILALAQHSGGLFRLIIVLAGSAMFLAEQEDARQVTKRHVDEAAAMREMLQEEDAPSTRTVPVGRGNDKDCAPVSASSEQMTPARLVPVAFALGEDPAPGSTATKHIPPPPQLGARRRFWVAPFAAGALAGLTGLGLAILAAAWLVSHGHPDPRERTVERASTKAAAPQIAEPLLPQAAPQLAETPPAQPPSPPAPPFAAAQALSPQTARPQPPAPQATTVLAFRGKIRNETMGQSGQLSLMIRSDAAQGSVAAQFHAYAGLIGNGKLTGRLGPDGRLNLSGRLMMGRNPYDCILSGTVSDGTLTGSATYVREDGTGFTRGTFTLSRL